MTTMKIYKYTLDRQRNTYGRIEVEMPEDGLVLHCADQRGAMTLWVLFEDVTPLITEARRFHIVGTGHAFELEAPLTYVTSVMQPPFVWHVFEEPRPAKAASRRPALIDKGGGKG